MKDVAHFLFGIFGNASGLFLFLAPVFFCFWVFFIGASMASVKRFPLFISEYDLQSLSKKRKVGFCRITFKRVVKNRSTEKFSGIPYVMTLLNCLLSVWYGLPFVSPHNILVSTINGIGAAIEIIYVVLFIIYAPKREKAKVSGLFTFVLIVFAAVALISLLALHGNSRKLFCGFAAALFSIIMYGSPLSIMTMVIKTKSVEFMPFFLSLFVFLCGTSWFIYGLLGRDPFVAVPNGVGSLLGSMQLILYVIYRDNNKGASSEKPTTADEDSVEMGNLKPHQEKQFDSNAN